MAKAPTPRVISPHDLRDKKGIKYHPNHLRRMWQAGQFPVPFKPSPHRIAWTEDVIDNWIAEKARKAEK